MSFIRRSIDSVNKEIQFEISESCQGINLRFNPEFNEFVWNMRVRVELVNKNNSNKLLYSSVFSDISRILNFAYKVPSLMLPFAINKSLILNDDNKLLVTLNYDVVDGVASVPTSFEYELNKYIELTDVPLMLKKIVVEDELTLSTETFPLLLLDIAAISYETYISYADDFGVKQIGKVYFGNSLINSLLTEGSVFIPIVTKPNQEVKLVGASTNYLVMF